jgi:LysR family nitrogen assimilation transcriptional regulator
MIYHSLAPSCRLFKTLCQTSLSRTRQSCNQRSHGGTLVDLWQLELLLAVLNSSSMTKAAEKVHLSPAAVSLQLQKLSAELRTDLFVRSGKKLLPTPAALRLAEQARSVLNQVRDMQEEFKNDPGKDARPFHFATGATTLIYRLGDPLRRLRKQYPQTEFHVTVAATEEMVTGLIDRQFDLALISLPVANLKLNIIPLFDEELLLLRPSPAYVRSHAIGRIPPADLSDKPFLLYPKQSNMRSIIDRFFVDNGVAPRVVMEASDTEVIKRLVECGFGYSILPESALRRQPKLFHTMRIGDHRLIRRQALAMVKTEYPRALTQAVSAFLQNSLHSQDARQT